MSKLHCYFCGGKECRYENWKLWTAEQGYLGVNAIDVRITSDILAMQRPSTRIIKEYGILSTFATSNILSIFNLQQSGEHVNCGDGIEEGGFSYNPEIFMDSGISYYNFGWTDMETPDADLMLNIVNVMAYSLENSKKIAVHCHAGLGRTGLTIACYLVYAQNMSASTAITIVRGKRPLSVQTKKQTLFVSSFEVYLKRIKQSFALSPDHLQRSVYLSDAVSFDALLVHQRKWMRAAELRSIRNIPKVIFETMTRILELCHAEDSENIWYTALDAFLQFEGIETLNAKFLLSQSDINGDEWNTVRKETEVTALINLMLYWIISLKDPIISDDNLRVIETSKGAWKVKPEIITKEVVETIDFVMKFLREVKALLTQIPSISKSTLDLGCERLAIYTTSHRNSLKFPVTYPILQKQIIPEDYYKSKMIESLKSLKTAQNAVVLNISSIKPLSVMQGMREKAEAIATMGKERVAQLPALPWRHVDDTVILKKSTSAPSLNYAESAVSMESLSPVVSPVVPPVQNILQESTQSAHSLEPQDSTTELLQPSLEAGAELIRHIYSLNSTIL